jgi:hypothetical protein
MTQGYGMIKAYSRAQEGEQLRRSTWRASWQPEGSLPLWTARCWPDALGVVRAVQVVSEVVGQVAQDLQKDGGEQREPAGRSRSEA